MKIHLHIECLVLEGIPLEKRHGSQVQVAVEAELARLIQDNGLSQKLQSGGALPRVRVGDLQFGPQTRPNQIGQQIAQSVYSGIGQTP